MEQIEQIETLIKDNYFKTKEELIIYLNRIKEEGSLIDDQAFIQLLSLYDSLNTKEIPLDMSNYSNVNLGDKNLIISKEDKRTLQSLEGASDFPNHFKSVQSELSVHSSDGLVNADQVFRQMEEQKKEITYMTLDEALSFEGIQLDILNKIKFFITNAYINPYAYKVNIEKGIFYNMETDEVYEVRKNEETGEYEIYSGDTKVYGQTNDITDENAKLEATVDRDRKAKPKIRRLINPNQKNAAFTKVGFLVTSLITFIFLGLMIIFLNR